MTIADNKILIAEIEGTLTKKLPVKLGVNKKNELVRLVFEICRANDFSLSDVLKKSEIDSLIKQGKGELFHKVKDRLLKMRYSSIGPHDDPNIVPVAIDSLHEECSPSGFDITPKRIFVEKSIENLEWTNDFLNNFPGIEVLRIDHIRDGMRALSRDKPVNLYNQRSDNLFLVRNKSSFVKICPCSKGVKRCGYWILNLGFGCSMDCSYCYLQLYSNASGFILPANIDEYYPHIETFDREASQRIRIGTGEFTDSLYLDRYTNYTSFLIPFFRKQKNLVLELKTKSNDIANILREEPNNNVVVSWSLNALPMAQKYEKGSISVDERIDAALQVARRGYQVGFHFDPIIYYPGWKDDYKAVVDKMFSFEEIREKTAWISLGTLRYTSGLKQTAEQRFSDNNLFYYGDFFQDVDGKLRYPRNLRIEMYNAMIEWIRSFDTSCWIYLCMEFLDLWKKTTLRKSDYSYQ